MYAGGGENRPKEKKKKKNLKHSCGPHLHHGGDRAALEPEYTLDPVQPITVPKDVDRAKIGLQAPISMR